MAGLREQKRVAARESLRTAAIDLFREQGFASTTVAEITARVGVSERTFFRYFAAKEDVLLGPISDLIPTLRERLAEQPEDASPLEVVREALIAVADEIEAPPVDQGAVPEVDEAQLMRRALALLAEWRVVIAQDVARRTGHDATDPYPQLVGAVAMAVVQSGAITHTKLRDSWEYAFATIAAGLQAPAPSKRKRRSA